MGQAGPGKIPVPYEDFACLGTRWHGEGLYA